MLVVPPVEVDSLRHAGEGEGVLRPGRHRGRLRLPAVEIGHARQDVGRHRRAVPTRSGATAPKPGLTACDTNAAGGRAYLLSREADARGNCRGVGADAGVHPALGSARRQDRRLAARAASRKRPGATSFSCAIRTNKARRRQFKFRITAARRAGMLGRRCETKSRLRPSSGSTTNTVEIPLTLEPLETVLLVFQPKKIARPARIEPETKPVREPIVDRARSESAGRSARAGTQGPASDAQPGEGGRSVPRPRDDSGRRGSGPLPRLLEMDDLPDDAAAVKVNGQPAGGVIGRPTRLDITRTRQGGRKHAYLIEPLAPKSARIVVYSVNIVVGVSVQLCWGGSSTLLGWQLYCHPLAIKTRGGITIATPTFEVLKELQKLIPQGAFR